MTTIAATGALPAATQAPLVSPTSPTTTDTDSNGTASTSGLNQLDNTQTFLQLLVAQLKNQDPTNPTDPGQFMTEIAQLTAVQSQTALDAEEQTVAADSMIGKDIVGTNSAGTSVSGLVSGVQLSSSGSPQLEVGTGSSMQTIALTSVSQITAAAAYGASSASPTT